MTVDEIINLENSMLVRYYFYDEELYSTAKKGISKERFIKTKDNYLANKILKEIGHNERFDEILYKYFVYMPALATKEKSVDRILCLDNLGICYVYLNEARCLYRFNELNNIMAKWETRLMDDPDYRKKCNLELADRTREILKEKRKEINACKTLEEFSKSYADDELINEMVSRYKKAGYKEEIAKEKTKEKLVSTLNDEITFLSTTIRRIINIFPIEYSDEVKKLIDPIKLGMLLSFKSMQSSFNSDSEEKNDGYENIFNFRGVYAYWFYKYIKENKDIYERYKNATIFISDKGYGSLSEYSLNDFIKIFEDFYKENMSNKRMLDKQEDSAGISFLEFEERFTERAERDKNKVKLEVAAKDWEILRAGTVDEERNKILKTIDDLSLRRKNKKKTQKDKESEEKLQSERINNLMKKWEFFDNSNYIITIKGINEMSGYIGYIYPNGTVMFEQFFDEKKETEPAYYKAIYVMDILNFINLSSLSKAEIIDYIKNNSDDTVKRIYHSKNWMKKAEKIINEDSLTEEKSNALKEFLDMLSEKKDSNNNEIKMTKIELENFSSRMKMKESRSGIVLKPEIKEENKKYIKRD